MLNYCAKRLLLLVPVFLAVSVVIFMIIHLVPGDPIDNMVQIGSSPEQKAALIAIATNTNETARLHRRWNGDGLPATRVIS